MDKAFNYHDYQAAQNMRSLSGNANEESLDVVAKQLESVFLQMMIKSMREANKAFESEMMDGQSRDFYQEMHDQQLSLSLGQKGGIGLADMIVAQLKVTMPKGDKA